MAEGAARSLGYYPWDDSLPKLPPAPQRILICCRDFKHSLVEDVQSKLLKDPGFTPEERIAKMDKLQDGSIHRIELTNGSSLKFMTYKQFTQDPMAAEGLDYDYAIFNEPPPRGLWISVNRGIAKRGGKASFHMTPIGGESAWIYDELVATALPHVHIIRASIEDSFIPEEKRDEWISTLDPDEIAARVRGEFRHLAGRIYKDYDPATHLLGGRVRDRVWAMVQNPAYPKGMVIDPHDRKPFFIAYFLVTPRNRIIFYRNWPTEPFHQLRSSSSTVADYAAWMRQVEQEDGAQIVWRIGDPNSTQRRSVVTGESVLDRFAKEGMAFNCRMSDKQAEKHKAVQDRLRERQLLFTNDCNNLDHGMRIYSWLDRPQDQTVQSKPAERGKDAADVVAYTCLAGVHYFDPRDQFEPVNYRPRYKGL